MSTLQRASSAPLSLPSGASARTLTSVSRRHTTLDDSLEVDAMDLLRAMEEENNKLARKEEEGGDWREGSAAPGEGYGTSGTDELPLSKGVAGSKREGDALGAETGGKVPGERPPSRTSFPSPLCGPSPADRCPTLLQPVEASASGLRLLSSPPPIAPPTTSPTASPTPLSTPAASELAAPTVPLKDLPSPPEPADADTEQGTLETGGTQSSPLSHVQPRTPQVVSTTPGNDILQRDHPQAVPDHTTHSHALPDCHSSQTSGSTESATKSRPEWLGGTAQTGTV